MLGQVVPGIDSGDHDLAMHATADRRMENIAPDSQDQSQYVELDRFA